MFNNIFPFQISISSVDYGENIVQIEKRRKKHLVAIPALRSEKSFVREHDFQVKMAVVRNYVCEQKLRYSYTKQVLLCLCYLMK